MQGLVEHAHVAGGQGLPQQRHQLRIIGERAFLATDVFSHFIGMHDGFRLEDHGRRDDMGQRVEGLDDPVGFRKVLAIGAQPFPDERHRVESQDFHPLVRKKQHLLHHPAEDLGVFVVQIPLIIVERGPHPFLDPVAIDKRAWMILRKHLAHAALEGVRSFAIRIHPVIILVILIAHQGFLSPFMLVGGVIENKIEHQ